MEQKGHVSTTSMLSIIENFICLFTVNKSRILLKSFKHIIAINFEQTNL